MKNIAYSLVFLGTVSLATVANADDQLTGAVYNAESYSTKDFIVKPEWKKTFADDEHFSSTSGAELYETLCQACHMEDGQGASGAGDYPSFVGAKRLRTPYYAIDVVLNGFRGMPGFRDMLSNEQIAGVVNHIRTNFGNQLDDNVSAEDIVQLRSDKETVRSFKP